MEKEMDEGRKRTLGVIAAIFACRKLTNLNFSGNCAGSVAVTAEVGSRLSIHQG